MIQALPLRLVNVNYDFQSKSKGEEMKMNTTKYTFISVNQPIV